MWCGFGTTPPCTLPCQENIANKCSCQLLPGLPVVVGHLLPEVLVMTTLPGLPVVVGHLLPEVLAMTTLPGLPVVVGHLLPEVLAMTTLPGYLIFFWPWQCGRRCPSGPESLTYLSASSPPHRLKNIGKRLGSLE